MSDETTLLPCPFCGGEAELVESDYGMFMTGYAVYCEHCCTKAGVTGRLGEAYEWTPIYNNEAEAIAAWNTRAEHHVYEQRITGSGSDWGEIMCDAFDSLLASACDACTFDELERFRAYIIKEVGE